MCRCWLQQLWPLLCLLVFQVCEVAWAFSVSSSSRRQAACSNGQRLEDILGSDTDGKDIFPRTWIPLAAVDQLDPSRPTPLQFMGNQYVTYRVNDDSRNRSIDPQWVVLDDVCPHRLAPLSEGRIDPDTQNLECAYHGYQIKGTDGSLQRIPQLDRLPSPASMPCVPSYPTMVHRGVLWAWLWMDDPLTVAGIPQAHPEGMARGIGQAMSIYQRDLPYGYDTLLENLGDPAHVPFAHHGLQGTRDDAIPINMTVVVTQHSDADDAASSSTTSSSSSSTSPYGFTMRFADRTMKKYRQGVGAFQAPYVLRYFGNYTTDQGQPLIDTAPFRLSTICIPTRPGWSRVIIFTGGGGDEDEEKGNKSPEQSDTEEKSSSPKLVSLIFRLVPTWLLHVFSSRFLDSDLAFLHYQEREARARLNPTRPIASTYYCPAPADRGVLAMRQWFRTYARAWEAQPLPSSPERRDDLFDRKEQHVKACQHCQTALQGISKWRRNAIGTLAASVVVLSWSPVAKVTAAGSLLLIPLLNTMERAITKGGYDHSKT